jgi:hypothetical protein
MPPKATHTPKNTLLKVSCAKAFHCRVTSLLVGAAIWTDAWALSKEPYPNESFALYFTTGSQIGSQAPDTDFQLKKKPLSRGRS